MDHALLFSTVFPKIRSKETFWSEAGQYMRRIETIRSVTISTLSAGAVALVLDGANEDVLFLTEVEERRRCIRHRSKSGGKTQPAVSLPGMFAAFFSRPLFGYCVS